MEQQQRRFAEEQEEEGVGSDAQARALGQGDEG